MNVFSSCLFVRGFIFVFSMLSVISVRLMCAYACLCARETVYERGSNTLRRAVLIFLILIFEVTLITQNRHYLTESPCRPSCRNGTNNHNKPIHPNTTNKPNTYNRRRALKTQYL